MLGATTDRTRRPGRDRARIARTFDGCRAGSRPPTTRSSGGARGAPGGIDRSTSTGARRRPGPMGVERRDRARPCRPEGATTRAPGAFRPGGCGADDGPREQRPREPARPLACRRPGRTGAGCGQPPPLPTIRPAGPGTSSGTHAVEPHPLQDHRSGMSAATDSRDPPRAEDGARRVQDGLPDPRPCARPPPRRSLDWEIAGRTRPGGSQQPTKTPAGSETTTGTTRQPARGRARVHLVDCGGSTRPVAASGRHDGSAQHVVPTGCVAARQTWGGDIAPRVTARSSRTSPGRSSVPDPDSRRLRPRLALAQTPTRPGSDPDSRHGWPAFPVVDPDATRAGLG